MSEQKFAFPDAAFALRSFAAVVALVSTAAAQIGGFEESTLGASDAQPFDGFGTSVAVSGDRALVGAPFEEPPLLNELTDYGAAYLYERTGTTWSQTAKLDPPTPFGQLYFGRSVALEDNRAFVGAEGEHHSGLGDAGAVYVYQRSGPFWNVQARLESSVPAASALFGYDLALDGDTLAVGIKDDPGAAALGGAVEIFTRNGTTWSLQQRLTASNASLGAGFGHRVALGGDVLLVGTESSTSWYIFERSGTSWTELQVIPGGQALATDGTYVMTGRQNGLGVNVLTRGATAWSITQTIEPMNPVGVPQFGWSSIGLEGPYLAIGARADGEAGVSAGAVHIYFNTGGSWVETSKLTTTAAADQDFFGADLALEDGRLVVGAIQHDFGCPGGMPNCQSGAAFAFRVQDLTPSFCDASDGSLAFCPCLQAEPDSGCRIASAMGGVRLDVVFTETAPQNRARLRGVGYPTFTTPATVVIRSTSLEPTPVVFGDGLRCVGLPVVRLAGSLAQNGVYERDIFHGAGPGTFNYQLWFRNVPISHCDPTAAFNLSNGRSLTW